MKLIHKSYIPTQTTDINKKEKKMHIIYVQFTKIHGYIIKLLYLFSSQLVQ